MPGAGRYAPSPSGPLHLGNLRTALLAWLSARSRGAPFLLRIEDLDRERSRPEHERGQRADLSALGIDHDGPVVRQSERTGLYEGVIARLDALGLLYPCYCTRAEIRDAVRAPHGPPDAYPGTCRSLTAAQRSARERSGRRPALRVRADAERITFSDRHRGPQSQAVDDFVVRRADGAHAYNLAVVIDDGEQGVGEVVRGEDLLESTGRQIWLAQRLGLPVPDYAHVPLVLNGEGQRLAKRDGAVTLAGRQALGESAAQVRGMLAASVGLASAGEAPSPGELLARYDPQRFTPPPSGRLPGL